MKGAWILDLKVSHTKYRKSLKTLRDPYGLARAPPGSSHTN